jgi:hypothetical protein
MSLSLHQRLLKTSSEEKEKNLLNFQSFLDKLRQQNEIRFLMDCSKGLGNQSFCTLFMTRLISLIDANTKITLVYNGGENTLQKLRILFPNFKNPSEEIQIEKATVNFLEYNDDTSLFQDQQTFGFAGGFELNSEQEFVLTMPHEKLLKLLNVQYLLNAFPSGWYLKDHIFIKNSGICFFGGDSGLDRNFDEYTFHYPNTLTNAPNWEELENISTDKQLHRIKLAKSLLDYLQEKTIELCPVYGVSVGGGQACIEPEEILPNLISGILHAKKQKESDIGKVVILILESEENFPKFCLSQIEAIIKESSSIKILFEELKNGLIIDVSDLYSRFEKNRLEDKSDQDTVQLALIINDYTQRLKRFEEVEKNLDNISSYFKKNSNGGKKIHYLSSADIKDTDDFTIKMEQFINDEQADVLVFSLHSVPPQLFQYLYSQATLPSVFEGKSSANLALYLGKPYLHLKSKACSKEQNIFRPLRYPYKFLPKRYESIAKDCEAAADSLHEAFECKNYEEKIQILSHFITETHKKKGALHEFFQESDKIYCDPANDKLLNICSALSIIEDSPGNTSEVNLQKLHDTILEKISEGNLVLIPDCIPPGPIRNRFENLLSEKKLSLTETSLTPHFEETKLTRFTLTGMTTDFGAKASAEITFNMWRQKLVSSCILNLLDKEDKQVQFTSSDTNFPGKILFSGF